MRLSDAMMLGSTLVKLNADAWNTCLLGVSVVATGGKDNWCNSECRARWPWIEIEFVPPPMIDAGITPRCASAIISLLTVLVEKGAITLEQAVDWVRSVEPAEDAPSEVSTNSFVNESGKIQVGSL